MKRIIMLISIFGILLVPLLPLVDSASAANLMVEAKPNPGWLGQEITITIATADEAVKYLWGPCNVLVYFGDNTPAPDIGKLESGPGGQLIKRTTHKYLKVGTYTIEVIPISCATSKANAVKTNVTIKPIKAVLPTR
jgi:PKD domain